MSQYRVADYRPEHAAAWRSLNEGWILECGFALEPKDHKVLGDAQGQVLDAGGHIFIIEDGAGDYVGCCALMKMDDGGFELAKMAVRPDARGKGLSKLLMQACVERAKALKGTRLYLETNSGLAPALRLYEQFGFVYLPQRDTPYARADVFMELRL
ncbi:MULTISPECIES: GNAT family N-acetyltransferase [unclassified Brevundimonas]|uniref:GNAT family N-acetyltransferase n=1 Tax=unclassified Brevundimonas TaxID=2622653 RepID=UPI0025C6289C|nr:MULTISPECIES: GNAT family N-acetyltransferase [unclassified Brevundimonas]